LGKKKLVYGWKKGVTFIEKLKPSRVWGFVAARDTGRIGKKDFGVRFRESRKNHPKSAENQQLKRG